MVMTKKQREEVIDFLTTNCECWKEKGSKELLAGFSDDRLEGLRTGTQSAIALNELVTDLGDEADEVTINEIPAFIKKKMDAKEEPDGDEADKKAKNKAKNAKTKNAKAKNACDDDMLNTDDEETGNKTKNKKPTANEWLENMPDELKPVWNAATEIEQSERKRLLDQLTANTSKDFAADYKAEPLAKLRKLVANTGGKKGTEDANANVGPLSIYPNANPAPTQNRSYDPNDKDMLALPKMDYGTKSA